jgi:hypothetical protein
MYSWRLFLHTPHFVICSLHLQKAMSKENIVHKDVSAGEEIADWEVAHRAGASKRSLNAWIIFVNLWATMGGMTYGCELSALENAPLLILLKTLPIS